MADAWPRCIAFVLKQEGGWSDNAADPGGATNMGITLGTFTRWRQQQGQPTPSKEDLRNIGLLEVQRIYYFWYWLESGADQMHWPMCLAHFDLAVNGGPARAAHILALTSSATDPFTAYMTQRLAWYKRLTTWPIFGVGWERRVNALIAESKIPLEETSMAERISDGAKRFNVFIERGTPVNGKIYRVKDIFTTLNGSWEPSGQVGSIPQWARDTYLRPWGAPDYFDDAGADHHVLGGIFNEATGRMVNGLNATTIHYYTATDNANHVDLIAKEKSGWANNIVFNKFNPGAGERGAWAWYPKSNTPADVVVGGGLPDGWHVSFFATWVLTDGATVPPVDPTDPTDAEIQANLDKWAREFSAHFAGAPRYE